jgi:hypothetical protein
MVSEAEIWKRCNTCKNPIGFTATYFVCSVSTCTRKRSGFVFCSVDCWEAHVPMMRHREAWAVEETAPTKAQWAAEQAAEGGEEPKSAERKSEAPRRATETSRAPEPNDKGATVLRRSGGEAEGRRITVPAAASAPAGPKEVLVVASRMKDYVRQRYGMNTSDAVMEVLSDQLRKLCDRAVSHARDDGRKTLMDRDFAFLTER